MKNFKQLKHLLTLLMICLVSQLAYSQCNVLFILDDSGSINGTERGDMTVSVQALADEIELNNPGVQIGVVQYSFNSQQIAPKFYTIETGYVNNPTIQNLKIVGKRDYLPATIAQMETDGLFSAGGQFQSTGAIFIFTDAKRQATSDSVLEQYPPGAPDPCAGFGFPCTASPFYEEYSDLSTALGGIPISIYRVGISGGSTAGVVQGGGIIVEGATNFTMTPTEISNFASNINVNCIPTNCGGGVINGSATVTPVLCPGGSTGSATATVAGGTGPYTYNWNTGPNTPTINNVPAGTYTVTIGDANGCTDVVSVTITEPPILSVNTTINDVSCQGANDGSATLTAIGGTGPYSYSWSNAQNGNQLINVPGGTYSYTIIDANGCTLFGSLTILDPSALTLTVSPTDVSCFGEMDGQATAYVQGGTTPYTYLWSNNEITPDAVALPAGNHSVVVTDANGCTIMTSLSIGSPTALELVSSLAQPVTCQGGDDGSALVSINGGMPPYAYQWSDNQITNPAIGLSAGLHAVTVSDINGCTIAVNVTVVEPTNPVDPIISSTNVSCFGMADGSVTVSPTGGTPGYTYIWNTGETTASLFGKSTGNYTVIVTDQNGCTAQASVLVDSPTMISAQVQVEDAICHGDENGTIAVVNPAGGVGPYLYSIDGGAFGFSPVFPGVGAGSYFLTVQDANGCEFELSNIQVQDNPPIQIELEELMVIQLSESVELNPTVFPNSPYSYNWSPETGLSCTDCISPIATPLETTTYNLLVTDPDACEAEASITVIVNKDRNVFIPNVFTPNGDGTNDAFVVFGGPDVAVVKNIALYSRWGELLFKDSNLTPNDPSYGWDGQHRGSPLNQGVFVYHVEVEFIDGEVIPYAGDFTLLR